MTEARAAEAMWLARSMVTTARSGSTDFIGTDNSVSAGYRLIPAVDPSGVLEVAGAVWTALDIGDGAAQLRRLTEYPTTRAVPGARAAASVRQTFGSALPGNAVHALGLPVAGAPL